MAGGSSLFLGHGRNGSRALQAKPFPFRSRELVFWSTTTPHCPSSVIHRAGHLLLSWNSSRQNELVKYLRHASKMPDSIVKPYVLLKVWAPSTPNTRPGLLDVRNQPVLLVGI